MTHRIAFALLALLLAQMTTPTSADTAQPPARADLLPGWAEDGVSVAALRLRLSSGWKTYWRMPGEAGLTPRFDWSGSENLAQVAITWPAPIAFEEFGMTSFGYVERMLLPLRVTPQDPEAPVVLRLQFEYGVCEKICVAQSAALELTLPPAAQEAPAQNALPISLALAATPLPAEALGLTAARCALKRSGDARRLTVAMVFDAAAPQAVAAVEGAPGVRFGPAEAVASGAALTVSAAMDSEAPAGWLARDAVTVTLFTDRGVYAHRGC